MHWGRSGSVGQLELGGWSFVQEEISEALSWDLQEAGEGLRSMSSWEALGFGKGFFTETRTPVTLDIQQTESVLLRRGTLLCCHIFTRQVPTYFPAYVSRVQTPTLCLCCAQNSRVCVPCPCSAPSSLRYTGLQDHEWAQLSTWPAQFGDINHYSVCQLWISAVRVPIMPDTKFYMHLKDNVKAFIYSSDTYEHLLYAQSWLLLLADTKLMQPNYIQHFHN